MVLGAILLNLSQNECWCVRVYLRLLYVFLSLLMYVYSSREKLKWKHLQIVGKNKHGFNNTKLLLRCISGYKVNNTYSCCWGVFQAAKLAITNHKYLPTGSIYIYIYISNMLQHRSKISSNTTSTIPSCCWGVFRAAKLAKTSHKHLRNGST